nr:MAG TPA_asm: hypothetical protein [Caudoviricetes sp.]
MSDNVKRFSAQLPTIILNMCCQVKNNGCC